MLLATQVKSSHVCFFPTDRKMLAVNINKHSRAFVIACPISRQGIQRSIRLSAGAFAERSGALRSIKEGGIRRQCLLALEKTYCNAIGMALYVVPLVRQEDLWRLTPQEVANICDRSLYLEVVR
jgi:hypothetical protein